MFVVVFVVIFAAFCRTRVQHDDDDTCNIGDLLARQYFFLEEEIRPARVWHAC